MSKCECGQPLALDAMKCPKCGKKFTIEPRFTGFEIPEPPIDQWREELSVKREYTEESLAEVKREAEQRQKKKSKRSGAKSAANARSANAKSPKSSPALSFKNRFKANREDRKAWEINGLKPGLLTLIRKPLSKIKQYFH
jgi:hypothetical protein